MTDADGHPALHADSPGAPPARVQRRVPSWRFMLRHPAHVIALGFGSGLSPVAPGTVGTLWAWVAFLVLEPFLDDPAWAMLIGAALPLGVWAGTRTAQHLGVADPSAVVWDEVVSFWTVLWLISPTGWTGQLAAFALFRFFDAAKPGPVGWADRLLKTAPGAPIGWRQGAGILFDDLVAAGCTLFVIAAWRWW